MPQFSPLINRISGPAATAWDVGDRAFAQMKAGRSIIHLGVGDPDIDTPIHIRTALVRAVEGGCTHYAPLGGEPVLRSAIAEHATGLYGSSIVANEVFVTAGAQSALYAVFQLIAGLGDEVIVVEPFYSTYPAVVTAGGASMVAVHLDSSTGYQCDVAQIEQAITPRTKAILINSPGNPSGAVFSQSTMNCLADLTTRHDIWLVSDEVNWALCYDGPHTSPMRCRAARRNVITINSLSKSHAMTGWRIGWVIAPQDVTEALITLAQPYYFGVNQFAQIAAATAIADGGVPVQINNLFRERRNVLVDGLRKSPNLRFSMPQGGMFVLVDVSATGQDGLAFAETLLEAEGVALVPGYGFGVSLSHHVRIGFLFEASTLAEAARRIVRHAAKGAN